MCEKYFNLLFDFCRVIFLTFQLFNVALECGSWSKNKSLGMKVYIENYLLDYERVYRWKKFNLKLKSK